MASIGIHNIKQTDVVVKHFDNFSVVNIEFTTQSEHETKPTYEKLDFYFDNAEQIEAFFQALSMARRSQED